MKKLLKVATVLILFPLVKTAPDLPWCQSSLGCNCISIGVDEFSCSVDNKHVGKVLTASEREPNWHITCTTGSLPDFVRANLTLGRIEHLFLLKCDSDNVPFAELLRAMNVDGLVQLNIDSGRLRSDSFRGFQDVFPSFRQLDLFRISAIEDGLLQPLSNLEVLSLHSCRDLFSFPETFLFGLRKLKYFQIFSSKNLTSLPVGFFDHNEQLKVLNLSSNAIQDLAPNLFRNLTQLEELVLNNNEVELIPNDLFHHNAKLKIFTWMEVIHY
jgi:hypothetical protein